MIYTQIFFPLPASPIYSFTIIPEVKREQESLPDKKKGAAKAVASKSKKNAQGDLSLENTKAFFSVIL